MADRDEFAIDNQAAAPASSPGGSPAAGTPPDAGEADRPVAVQVAGRSRLWLLILLVLLAAGGGYWSLQTDQPAVPPAAPTQVVLPPPPPPPAEVAVPAPVVPVPAVPMSPPASLAPTPVSPPAPAAVKTAPPAPVAVKPSSPSASDGPWRVAAGTYQTAKAADAAAAKIRKLGYQPLIRSQTRAVVLTRLRLGTFPAGEVQEALAYLRGLVPDAFVLRSGEQFTIYAGTYASPRYIREISDLLASEGVRVEEEPVEVQRTVSSVEFGGFADQAAAAEAAARVRTAGIAAEVIPSP